MRFKSFLGGASLFLVAFFYLHSSHAVMYMPLKADNYRNIVGKGVAIFCKVKEPPADGKLTCNVTGKIKGPSDVQEGGTATFDFSLAGGTMARTMRYGMTGQPPSLNVGDEALLYIDTNGFGKNTIIGGECYGVFRGYKLPNGKTVYANCTGNRNLFPAEEFNQASKNSYIRKMVQDNTSGMEKEELIKLLSPQQTNGGN